MTNRVWVVREPDRIFVIFARCTHLGCTPEWKPSENKFKCPCHGSGYDSRGRQLRRAGAAPDGSRAHRTRRHGENHRGYQPAVRGRPAGRRESVQRSGRLLERLDSAGLNRFSGPRERPSAREVSGGRAWRKKTAATETHRAGRPGPRGCRRHQEAGQGKGQGGDRGPQGARKDPAFPLHLPRQAR